MYAERFFAGDYFAARYYANYGLSLTDPLVKNPTSAAITAGYATTASLGSVVATVAVLGSTGLTTAPLGSTGQTTAPITS